MNKVSVRPISRDSLTDGVVSQIKEMILNGAVEPGQLLPPQSELATGFNVGLATVREAIRGLSLIGILETQPGRGTFVSPDAGVALRMLRLLRAQPDELDLTKVFQARRMLEVELTCLAAEKATEQDLQKIEQSLDMMENALLNGDSYVTADISFHDAIAAAAKNELIEDCYHFFQLMLSKIIQQIVVDNHVRLEGLELQRQILEAIRAHDVQTARDLAKENIENFWETIKARGMSQTIADTPTTSQ